MASLLPRTDTIWKDGELIPWEDATLHLLSTAVQFGASVFEGIRCYPTSNGPAIFRLHAHIRRLFDSAIIYRMRPDHEPTTIIEACRSVVRENRLESCYVRPMVLRGFGGAGLYAPNSPIETYVAAWPWGSYLGEEGMANGVDVCTSSWTRAAPNTFPVAAKAAGHYNAATLMKAEAVGNGFAEGIALGPDGLVSEGSGQNLFLVRDGIVVTPFLDGTSLQGITRDAVLTMAQEMGLPTREQHVPRESLYTADELFFTGTASEVTPIRSVDRITVGSGGRGPITERLQTAFLDLVHGRADDPHGWLTHVND